MVVNLEIETGGPMLAIKLFGASGHLSPGAEIAIPGNAVLQLRSMREHRALDYPTIVNMGLSFGAGVGASMVANWLYEKLKGKGTKLRIDRIEIKIDKDEIERIIIEKIEKGE